MRINPINFTSFGSSLGVNNVASGADFNPPAWPYKAVTPEQIAARKQLKTATDAYMASKVDKSLGLYERNEVMASLEAATRACRESFDLQG